jgi:hypothetical protein
MKEVEKKDAPDVSGGYVTDPVECPITDYPKYPNGGPLGDEDLPVTNNF